MQTRLLIKCALLLAISSFANELRGADDFEAFLKPLFAEHCVKCHGKEKVKGKVNLKEIGTTEQFLKRPELIKELIDVVDANDMPPEDEAQLTQENRTRLLATLKSLLRTSTTKTPSREFQIRRLNRFQYNNCIKDLFLLDRDAFNLPEKLMTRHGNYFDPKSNIMPGKVDASCRALEEGGGMKEVKPFPKDLRAAHGFDNQANQLTLSPLLLDTFLKLGVSILESPDFNEQNVGIWDQFFKEPAAEYDPEEEMVRRIQPFLKKAFRGYLDAETLERYESYALAKLGQGLPFTDAMKKVASATLSSPLFLYRYGAESETDDELELASNLSFFLWGSGPDSELLQLAESGSLSSPETLEKTIERMLLSPKIERFLDTFPSQWMQLENILAATPDPNKHRLFSLDKNNPAGLQMVLEPLLLFDAVFIENRPVIELISPTFGYRSPFLEDWYTSDLEPAPLDEAEINEENRAREERRWSIEATINKTRVQMGELDRQLADPIGAKLVDLNLKPGQMEWELSQAELVAGSVVLSTWHRIGPFGAATFDEAHVKPFLNETEVNLGKKHGNLKWEEAKDYLDGMVHTLSGANSATYLYRTIQCDSARSLEVSLGTDDSFKLWLNGRLITDKKVTRGVAPDQDQLRLELAKGENRLLMKVANGGGGYGFYFKARTVPLPGPVIAALKASPGKRTEEQENTLAKHYLSIAPELEPIRKVITAKKAATAETLRRLEEDLNRAPKPQGLRQHREEAQRRFDDEIRGKLRSPTFERVAASDPRYGGVITTAAMLSMTSGPRRTHPIARGAWIIEVIFNDPPPPPPNDVPPLNEDASGEHLTIREKFAKHRENPDCAGCHSRLDPLGFALENFDITGRWRDKYENGRVIDSSGTFLKKHQFNDVVAFKESLVKEKRRFAKAFAGHLLRFALSRELSPVDSLTVETIVNNVAKDDFRLKSLIKEVILSDSFLQQR